MCCFRTDTPILWGVWIIGTDMLRPTTWLSQLPSCSGNVFHIIAYCAHQRSICLSVSPFVEVHQAASLVVGKGHDLHSFVGSCVACSSCDFECPSRILTREQCLCFVFLPLKRQLDVFHFLGTGVSIDIQLCVVHDGIDDVICEVQCLFFDVLFCCRCLDRSIVDIVLVWL